MATANRKNGLIELIRFLCSVWVAYYHGFFPILSGKFNGANVSVDFFFLITGMFFLKSVEKYRDKPYFPGVRSIIWGRTKRFAVLLAIAAGSVLLSNIIFPMDLGFNWPLSFLWFFAAQYLLLALYFLLYKKVRNKTVFNIILVVIILISMSLFKISVQNIHIPLRTPAMFALGMLLSQIPSLKIVGKDGSLKKGATVALNSVGFAISAGILLYLAYLPQYEIWKLHLMCCVICPAVLYFANTLPVYGKFFDLLGEFSLYIYLGQCPIIIHHYAVSRDTRDQFPILCIVVVVMFIIYRLVNRKKKDKGVALGKS